MKPNGLRILIHIFVAFLLLTTDCTTNGDLRAPEVQYEPTPMDVVQTMLELAEVRRDELVTDLDCGDEHIVIETVRHYGARGLCIDIDPQHIAETRENARRTGIAE